MNKIFAFITFLLITILLNSCSDEYSYSDAEKNLNLNKETFSELEQYLYAMTDSIFQQDSKRKILFYREKKEVHVQIYNSKFDSVSTNWNSQSFAYKNGTLQTRTPRNWIKKDQVSLLNYLKWNKLTLDKLDQYLKKIDCEMISIDGTADQPFIYLRYKFHENKVLEYVIRREMNNETSSNNIVNRIKIIKQEPDLNWHLKNNAY
jgi:hypothetical protein